MDRRLGFLARAFFNGVFEDRAVNPFKIKDSTEGRVLFLPLVEAGKRRVERKNGVRGCLFLEK